MIESNMINKLKNLSNWLRSSGFKAESASLLKISGVPAALQGLFDEEQLQQGTGTPRTLDEVKEMMNMKGLKPPQTLEEVREMMNMTESTPQTLEEVREMFSSELDSAKSLKDKILYERNILKKGPRDEGTVEFIKKIQTRLKELGYPLPGHGADGVFGNETKKAIIEFQKNNKIRGLLETGEIDASTLMILESPLAIKSPELLPSPKQSKQPSGETPRSVSGRPGRSQLANMSPQTRDKLYKLTQAEVGSQGASAQQAFMETVANRSAIQGRTIDYTVSNRKYYQPIMGEGKSIDTLRPVSEATRAKYDEILEKVIAGSNITNGATHNASGNVAKNWDTRFDGQPGTRHDIGGETFYSKTYEQKKIKKLNTPDQSPQESKIPPSKGARPAGEYSLPKVSFVSVPCISAANLAIKESREQWDNGNFGETDPRAEPLIQKYFGWTSMNSSWKRNIDRWGTGRREFGPHKGKRRLNPVKGRDKNGTAVKWAHWSAAYVSWVMGQYDGEGAKWYVLEGHSGYIRAFKRMRRKVEANPEDHIGKMYYLWFTKEEMDKYGMKPEPGDVIGRGAHCDIYIGGNQLIGGNTIAKNKSTGNKKRHNGGTSGPKPLRWKSGFGIIKRVKVTGPGTNDMLVA